MTWSSGERPAQIWVSVKRDIAVREGQRKGPPERGLVCRQKVETRRSLLRFGAFVRLVRR
jgi:hypothetical protein